MAALDFIVIRCAIEPHPDVAFAQIREFAQPAPLDVTPVERIELLAGLLYHASATSDRSGTRSNRRLHVSHRDAERKASDRARAQGAGKRPEARCHRQSARGSRSGTRPLSIDDHHRPAIDRLQRDRIAVRVDDSDKLLHSKVIVIDDRTVVLGSHNWTAGSYFGFDDLSFLISSEEICRQQRRRFNELWRRGEPAPRRR